MTFRLTLLTTFCLLLTTNRQVTAQSMPDPGPCPNTHPIILALTLSASGVGPVCAPRGDNLGPDSAIWLVEDKLNWLIYGDRNNGAPHPNPFKKICESNDGIFVDPGLRKYMPAQGMCTPLSDGNLAHTQQKLVVCCSEQRRNLDIPDVYQLGITCEDYQMRTIRKQNVKIREAGDSCTAATKASEDKFYEVLQDFGQSCNEAHGETALANDYSSSRCTKDGSTNYGYRSADLLCCGQPVTTVDVPNAQSDDLES